MNNKKEQFYYDSEGYVQIYRDEKGKRYIKTEPVVEEISKDDIRVAYRELLRNKPQQVSVGEFQIRFCESCAQDFILHKRQVFCPICKRIIDIVSEDANEGFDEMFQVWQADKNFLENILQGNKDAKLYVLPDEDEEDDVNLTDPIIDDLMYADNAVTTDGKWGDSPLLDPIVSDFYDNKES